VRPKRPQLCTAMRIGIVVITSEPATTARAAKKGRHSGDDVAAVTELGQGAVDNALKTAAGRYQQMVKGYIRLEVECFDYAGMPAPREHEVVLLVQLDLVEFGGGRAKQPDSQIDLALG